MGEKTILGLDTDKLPKMSKEDRVLLILAHETKGKLSHCVALMNEVFFFLKESAPAMEEEFGFRGTGSGPYSQVVAAAVDKLVSDSMLEIKMDMNTGIKFYSLTEKGNAKAKSLLKKVPEKEGKRIRFAQFLAQRMGNIGILQYLSSVHPEYVYIRMAGETLV